MGKSIRIEQLAAAVNEQLEEYSKLTALTVKTAVKKAGKTVTQGIKESAPEKTGKYAKSWKSRVTAENSQSISVTVYSPTRYIYSHYRNA